MKGGVAASKASWLEERLEILCQVLEYYGWVTGGSVYVGQPLMKFAVGPVNTKVQVERDV